MESVRIAPGSGTSLEHLPDAARVLAGDPRQTITNLYDSADGKFAAGLWACAPGTWRVAYTEDEFCHLLEGTVELRGDDGSVAAYGPGDSFVVPAGFTGTWQVHTPARKLYAIYQPS